MTNGFETYLDTYREVRIDTEIAISPSIQKGLGASARHSVGMDLETTMKARNEMERRQFELLSERIGIVDKILDLFSGDSRVILPLLLSGHIRERVQLVDLDTDTLLSSLSEPIFTCNNIPAGRLPRPNWVGMALETARRLGIANQIEHIQKPLPIAHPSPPPWLPDTENVTLINTGLGLPLYFRWNDDSRCPNKGPRRHLRTTKTLDEILPNLQGARRTLWLVDSPTWYFEASKRTRAYLDECLSRAEGWELHEFAEAKWIDGIWVAKLTYS